MKMKEAEDIIRRYRNALRALARQDGQYIAPVPKPD
jgi:hypothetical protein